MGDEKKAEEVRETEETMNQPADSEGPQPEANPETAPDAVPAPKKPVTRERSVEELSMSDDDSPAAKKLPVKTAFVPKEQTEEKTTDVFKNLYSEFKEYIPSKDQKEDPNAKKDKPGFMAKARGFFGL